MTSFLQRRKIPLLFGKRKPAGSAPAALHILDHFTGADGTALASHTPDINTTGNPWTIVSGTFTLQSGKAAKTGDNGVNKYAVIDTGNADVTIRVKPSSLVDSSGIAMRVAAADDTWVAVIRNTLLSLYKQVAGAWTLRGQASGVFTADDTLEVQLDGLNIQAFYQTGEVLYTSASHNQTVTKHGLDIYATAVQLDDFEVVPT